MLEHKSLVVLQPTSFCNIDCSYCYLPERAVRNRMSDLVAAATFGAVFGAKALTKPVAFLWHLGEPLAVKPAFYERAFEACARSAAGASYTHSFQTNGILLDDKWIELIKRHQVRIGVSVDGPAEVHDAKRTNRRGEGTHSQVMAGVELLRQAGIPFSTISVLTEASLERPDEMFDFYLQNGLFDVAFNVEEVEGAHRQSSLAEVGALSLYKSFLGRFLQRIDETGGAVKVREVWGIARTLTRSSGSITNTMSEAFRILNVAANGDFSTWCPELITAATLGKRSFIIGNVMTTSIDEAAKSAVFKALSHEIEVGKAKCKAECAYWRFCGGGSPSNKFFEHGRLDVAETMTCRIHVKATADVVMDYMANALQGDARHAAI
jgi:uncharacterized protein